MLLQVNESFVPNETDGRPVQNERPVQFEYDHLSTALNEVALRVTRVQGRNGGVPEVIDFDPTDTDEGRTLICVYTDMPHLDASWYVELVVKDGDF